MKYPITDYIPEEVEGSLASLQFEKKLPLTIQDAFKQISEDLCYFQTDIDEDV